jgi:hypothetical protein
MKSSFIRLQAIIAVLLLLSVCTVGQQSKTVDVSRTPQVVRTTIRHEVRRFAYGGTLTVIGAPAGSITIEGWPRNEVDVSAEIQLRADSEADLDLLAAVNTFVLDEDANHLQILTTGTHDKAFMRSVAKKFSKTLLGLPWKVDYRIRVPFAIDLEVNAGRGPISIRSVEGNIRLSAAESDANFKLTGGTLLALVAIGKVTLQIPAKSWRGVGGELRLAAGDVSVEIPGGFSGDFDAEILRSGKISTSVEGLEPRERATQTAQKIKVRAGAGGATFNLIVGDGMIIIKKMELGAELVLSKQ